MSIPVSRLADGGLSPRPSSLWICFDIKCGQFDLFALETRVGYQNSAGMPEVTDAVASWTGTRVPRMTGVPLRISGSETTFSWAAEVSEDYKTVEILTMGC